MGLIQAGRAAARALCARCGVDGERGATMVEYAVIVFIIVVFCMTAVAFLSGATKENFDCTASAISTWSGSC